MIATDTDKAMETSDSTSYCEATPLSCQDISTGDDPSYDIDIEPETTLPAEDTNVRRKLHLFLCNAQFEFLILYRLSPQVDDI